MWTLNRSARPTTTGPPRVDQLNSYEPAAHGGATATASANRPVSRHGFSGQVDQVELVDLERKTVATREEEFLAAVP
jgi:hypothetical protein